MKTTTNARSGSNSTEAAILAERLDIAVSAFRKALADSSRPRDPWIAPKGSTLYSVRR